MNTLMVGFFVGVIIFTIIGCYRIYKLNRDSKIKLEELLKPIREVLK